MIERSGRANAFGRIIQAKIMKRVAACDRARECESATSSSDLYLPLSNLKGTIQAIDSLSFFSSLSLSLSLSFCHKLIEKSSTLPATCFSSLLLCLRSFVSLLAQSKELTMANRYLACSLSPTFYLLTSFLHTYLTMGMTFTHLFRETTRFTANGASLWYTDTRQASNDQQFPKRSKLKRHFDSLSRRRVRSSRPIVPFLRRLPRTKTEPLESQTMRAGCARDERNLNGTKRK